MNLVRECHVSAKEGERTEDGATELKLYLSLHVATTIEMVAGFAYTQTNNDSYFHVLHLMHVLLYTQTYHTHSFFVHRRIYRVHATKERHA